jgi:DNA-binding MarR family transcriptional regulator
MNNELPKRFSDHPVLLMLTVLRHGRRHAMRQLSHERRQMHLPHYAVGAVLTEFGPLSQKEVSERIAMDPSDIVPIIDKMERAHMVRRLRDEKDRRRYILTLTDRGTAFMERMDRMVGDRKDDLLAPLTPEEREEFIRILRKLLTHLS